MRPGGLARRVLLAVTGAAAAAVTVSTVVRPSGTQLPLFDLGLYNLVAAASAAACFLHCGGGPLARRSWRVGGTGLAIATVANLYYSIRVSGRSDVSYPSIDDWLYLAASGLQIVAVALLLAARLGRGAPMRILVDGLVGGLGVAALAAAAAGPVLTVTGAEPAVVAVNLAYPVSDVLMLLLVAGGVSALGGRIGRPLALLAGAGAVFAVGDVTYLLLDSAGRYVEGTALDATWAVGSLLIAVAALLPEPAPPDASVANWGALAFPATAAVAALTLLVYGQSGTLPPLAGVLAAGCVLAAILGTMVTFRELAELGESRRQARTDELTGLPNRRRFLEHLDDLFSRRRPGGTVALLLVDLDRFKEINDALGHHVGDDLLRMVGPRLAAGLGARDLLARLGGDEFAVLLAAPTDHLRADRTARMLRAALSAPFELGDVSLHVDASIGIALAPDHATEPATLLRMADVAMYDAKSSGDGHVLYSAARDNNDRHRLETIEQLRTALDVGHLTVHYQPKVRLSDGSVIGVEALVRWQHPTRGLLPPADFLDLAEQTGLMHRVSAAVMEQALAGAVLLWRAGVPVPVAVNMPPEYLLDPGLPARLSTALHRHGLSPSLLSLEITETALMADRGRGQDVLRRLRMAGHTISLDDYGTGYSSLAYLRELEVDELKLDGLFVRDLGHDVEAQAIVRSTIELAHSLGISVVAEGVESLAAVEVLAQLGCDAAQGFVLARPMPVERLVEWLGTHRYGAPVPEPPGRPLRSVRTLSSPG